MDITFNVTQEGTLFNSMQAEETLRRQVKSFIEFCTNYAWAEIVKLTPVGATGNARNSIKTTITEWQGSVSTDVDYVSAIESGTKPHFPGPPGNEALKLWVERKNWWPKSMHEVSEMAQEHQVKTVSKKVGKKVARQIVAVDMLDRRVKALQWIIYHYGTSRTAQQQGGHRGPTGGFGYWMFEQVGAKLEDVVVPQQLEGLGLALVQDLSK